MHGNSEENNHTGITCQETRRIKKNSKALNIKNSGLKIKINYVKVDLQVSMDFFYF